MPINSEVSALYPEKLCKSTTATPTSASASTPSSSVPNKGNGQNEKQATLISSSGSKQIENSLIKHQGQKWQQYFEFEKMLKQIRIAEKHLRSKGDGSTSSSNNGKSSNSPNVATVSPLKVVNASSFKCSRSLKQVQRLNGNDMHYYGIVPKQTAMDVIVCSICRGIYTKVGFNNHMMLQHPAVWSTISTKLASAAPSSDAYSLIVNDNSQDCIRDGITGGAEIIGSPSDLSGIMSTSSNASSSSSSLSSSTCGGTARHKGSKVGSTAGSSSSSTSSSGPSRSRSKQTKHTSNAATIGIHSSNTSSEAGQSSSKSSKKNSSASSTSSAAAVANAQAALNTSSADAAQAITIYSSSSNSSCSLPPTPKMVNVNVADAVGPSGVQDTTLSPASLSLSDAKDKVTTDSTATFVVASKKKVKSPTFAVQESVDSSASNSSSEYDQASSNGTITSSKSSQAPFVVASKEIAGSTLVGAKLAGVRELSCFDSQISELHQAVSSITDSQENSKNHMCTENMAAPNLNTNAPGFPVQTSTTIESGAKVQAIAPPIPAVPSVLSQNYTLQDMTQTNDDIMPHNTSDENSMLTLEDVLDSKFLNEILNTTESDIHFDENELDTAAQQSYQQPQPSATKRMRYDESVMGQSHQPTVAEMSGEFSAYQQQQVQQQYGQYDSSNLEDIKVFGAPQQSSMDAQYQAQYGKALQQSDQQQQLTTIDAIQLQQLLYQQQNLNVYTGGLDASTSSSVQHQSQFDQNGVVSAKHIIDLCSTEDLQKSKGLSLAMSSGEFSAMASINSTFEGNNCGYEAVAPHFQLFNVPSLTDDMSDDVDMLVPNVVDGVARTTQQYVLPSNEEHLIYEITDNNQVAVMSQQRQQQVIAEFLTQANYENIGHMNTNSTVDNLTAITNPTVSALTVVTGKDVWDDPSNDLMDFDFSYIETVKSLAGSNATAIDSKSVKTENSRYCDDFYFNVFIYAGIPRPLSINDFGLVKLPLCAATTFRKHLLSSRKANNSPITLGGGINGMVGNNASSASTRLANVNSKSMPNYFSNLSGGNSACNTVVSNEFSIGSITITNSPISQHQVYTYPKQMGIGNGSGNSAVDITFNTTTTNGSATSPVSSLHRSRSKTNNVSTSTAVSVGRNKSQGNSAPIVMVTSASRFTTRPNMNMLSQNAKTIYVCSTPTNINDRVKFIKRGALLACKAEVVKKHKFSSRQIADILGNVGKNGNLKQQLSLQQNTTMDGSNEALVDEQIRLNRVNHFYERRRKLLHSACNKRQEQDKQRQSQQLKQKLLKQHLFSRMFSDCGIGSLPHCKSSNSSSTGSSDTVRVFV